MWRHLNNVTLSEEYGQLVFLKTAMLSNNYISKPSNFHWEKVVLVQVDRADHASKILLIISLYWPRSRLLHYRENISKLTNNKNLGTKHSQRQLKDTWLMKCERKTLYFWKFSRSQLMYDEGIMICWIIEEILIII